MAKKLELLKRSAELRKQCIGVGIDRDIGEKQATLTITIKRQKQLHDAALKRASEAQISEQHAEIHRPSRCMAGTKRGKRNRYYYSGATRSRPSRTERTTQ
eukprot:3939395-Pyramimonas_sp.AAC.1